jgi:ABC-type multidrug transport system fused ATPase/permease subunit
MDDEPSRPVTGRRLLLGEVGRQRRALRRLLSWTGCEALPALLSGQLIGRALDRGFLAGQPLVGLGHLAAFGAVHALAALAVRRSYPAAGTIVEALRDMLVHRVVDTTLRRAAAGTAAPDQAAVARLVQYLVMSLEPALRQLVHGTASSTLRLVITLRRLVETTTVPAAPPPSAHTPTRHGHLLELDRVTFAYGAGEPLVSELSLTAPEGDHIAIVGQSGIGKSTVANLIAGIERPTGGEIRIGGAPVHRLEPSQRHESIVLIPQQAYVFAGTVADNLRYLRPDLPQRELDRTVELLGLVPLVSRLGGYRAEVQPAVLSAGERQLLALARAYVSAAPVIVLDEATCHLDPQHEALAERAFADRPGTLIVIAHRISSALRARRILVIDGTRSEIGVHSEHLATSPLYADLARNWDHSLFTEEGSQQDANHRTIGLADRGRDHHSGVTGRDSLGSRP